MNTNSNENTAKQSVAKQSVAKKKPVAGIKYIISGSANSGKEQPLTSKVHTPSGYVDMGSLKIGQVISHPTNKDNRIIDIFPQGKKRVYEVHLSDGSTVECGLNHLWEVYRKDYSDKKTVSYHQSVLPLNNIITLLDRDVKLHIRLQDAIEVKSQLTQDDIDPYTLGILIGDGCFSEQMCVSYHADDYEFISSSMKIPPTYIGTTRNTSENGIQTSLVRNYRKRFKKYGLLNVKSKDRFVPTRYLSGSIEERTELLRGLMDSDGSISKSNCASYSTSSMRLLEDIKSLVESLGGIVSEYTTDSRKYNDNYNITIRLGSINPFKLPRKADKWSTRGTNIIYRKIVKVVKTDNKVYQQCISVSSDDNLYLTDNMVTTHNTSITKGLKDAYVLNFDSEKTYPLDHVHTNVYHYKQFQKVVKKDGKPVKVNEIPNNGIEWTGLPNFKKEVVTKLKKYKEVKGRLPRIVVLDTATSLYGMLVAHNNKTVKNVYGSLALKIKQDVDDFNMWLETLFVAKGIDVVLLTHAVFDSGTESIVIASEGSKKFADKGGLLSIVDYATYLYIDEEGIRTVAHTTAGLPCRSLLEDVPETELVDDFNIQKMIEDIRTRQSKVPNNEI